MLRSPFHGLTAPRSVQRALTFARKQTEGNVPFRLHRRVAVVLASIVAGEDEKRDKIDTPSGALSEEELYRVLHTPDAVSAVARVVTSSERQMATLVTKMHANVTAALTARRATRRFVKGAQAIAAIETAAPPPLWTGAVLKLCDTVRGCVPSPVCFLCTDHPHRW